MKYIFSITTLIFFCHIFLLEGYVAWIYNGLTDEHWTQKNHKWSCLIIHVFLKMPLKWDSGNKPSFCCKFLFYVRNNFIRVWKSEIFIVQASWFTIGKSLMDHLASHCVKGTPWHIEHIIFLFVHTSTCPEKLFAFFHFSCFWYITTHELLHNVMLNGILLS